MTKCYGHEECEYNGQPECHLPDGMECPHEEEQLRREVGRPQDASREYIRQQWRLIRRVNDSAERRI